MALVHWLLLVVCLRLAAELAAGEQQDDQSPRPHERFRWICCQLSQTQGCSAQQQSLALAAVHGHASALLLQLRSSAISWLSSGSVISRHPCAASLSSTQMADNTREPGADLPEPTSTGRVISLKECQEHVREDDCWLVINGKALDVTDFMDEHPGGLDILLQSTGAVQPGCSARAAVRQCSQLLCAGKDASQDFEDINHSATAHKLLDKYAIGDFEVRYSLWSS